MSANCGKLCVHCGFPLHLGVTCHRPSGGPAQNQNRGAGNSPTNVVHTNNNRMLVTFPCVSTKWDNTVPCASTKWDKFDSDDDLDDTDSDNDSFDNYELGNSPKQCHQ